MFTDNIQIYLEVETRPVKENAGLIYPNATNRCHKADTCDPGILLCAAQSQTIPKA